MNVLLLGNGFDLHYKLPTKYANFLHTVEYLINNTLIDVKSVGQIFSNQRLQSIDSFIKECYMTHRDIFNKTEIKMENITRIIDLMQDNMWFLYLLKSYNKDVGWIDFEKEISFVLRCFNNILSQSDEMLPMVKLGKEEAHILNCFGFFVNKPKDMISIGTYDIKTAYRIEYPLASGILTIDKEKVIKTLKESLLDLEEALKLYLLCFVENTYDLLSQNDECKKIRIFSNIDNVVTFNYTNTYEKLYLKSTVYHLHGNVKGQIILGVNPDESDSLESIDTCFIGFKKYYRRALYTTDYDYLRWIADIKNFKKNYRLVVMGHSLDVTDKDILTEVFEYAKEIIILYHNENAIMSYIENLVRLFGKEGFDNLRREKNLMFLSLDSDFTEFARKMEQKAYESILNTIVYNEEEPFEVI